jgi:hypothetical protein
MCEVTARTLKKKTRKETNLKFYKIMAVPYFYMTAKHGHRERETATEFNQQ